MSSKKPLAIGDKIKCGNDGASFYEWICDITTGHIVDPFAFRSHTHQLFHLAKGTVGIISDIAKLPRLNERILRVKFEGYPDVLVCPNRDHSQYRRI